MEHATGLLLTGFLRGFGGFLGFGFIAAQSVGFLFAGVAAILGGGAFSLDLDALGAHYAGRAGIFEGFIFHRLFTPFW